VNVNEYHWLVHQPIRVDFQYGRRTPLSHIRYVLSHSMMNGTIRNVRLPNKSVRRLQAQVHVKCHCQRRILSLKLVAWLQSQSRNQLPRLCTAIDHVVKWRN